MTVIGILSAKGGVGASLVATNLGCVLAGYGQTLLLDLNPGSGADDLLLDLSPQRSWADLLPGAYILVLFLERERLRRTLRPGTARN